MAVTGDERVDGNGTGEPGADDPGPDDPGTAEPGTAEPGTAGEITIEEAARRLGVHYMTAYRAVRTGRLPATQRGGRWRVRTDDLVRLSAKRASGGQLARQPTRMAERRRRLAARLVAGDLGGCWTMVEEALVQGASPDDVELDLLAPALRQIGDQWAAGTTSVHDEHRATAVAIRLVGRLGPLFLRRGPPVGGTFVLGGAPGDPHLLPTVLLADVLRLHRLRVIELGADVPATSFLEAARAIPDLRAVGVSLSDGDRAEDAAGVLAALRRAHPEVLLLAGGPALGSRPAAVELGADDWAPDARRTVELLGGRVPSD